MTLSGRNLRMIIDDKWTMKVYVPSSSNMQKDKYLLFTTIKHLWPNLTENWHDGEKIIPTISMSWIGFLFYADWEMVRWNGAELKKKSFPKIEMKVPHWNDFERVRFTVESLNGIFSSLYIDKTIIFLLVVRWLCSQDIVMEVEIISHGKNLSNCYQNVLQSCQTGWFII